MQSFRDLMNLVEDYDTQTVYQPSPDEIIENTELLEAMRRVEALFDY